MKTNENKENKDKFIMVRVEPELKEQFYSKCKDKAINPSAWLRLQIEKFLKEK